MEAKFRGSAKAKVTFLYGGEKVVVEFQSERRTQQGLVNEALGIYFSLLSDIVTSVQDPERKLHIQVESENLLEYPTQDILRFAETKKWLIPVSNLSVEEMNKLDAVNPENPDKGE